MKAFGIAIFVAALVAGCESAPKNSTTSMDLSFRQIRQSLRGEPIPYPAATPFDSISAERLAYMAGFKQGWNVAIDQGPGAFLSVPQAYRQPEQIMQAWKTGYQDGTLAVSDLVKQRAIEASKSTN